jgi:hypothetical protein
VTELDEFALADLVETEIYNRQLTRLMIGTSPVISRDDENAPKNGDDPSAKKNPYWMLKLDYLRERRAQRERFGMDPSSRSKIASTGPQETDPVESALH